MSTVPVAVGAPAATAAAAKMREAKQGCKAQGRRTIAASAQAVVFKYAEDDDRIFIGCDRKTGRSITLSRYQPDDQDRTGEFVRKVVLTGRFVALSIYDTDFRNVSAPQIVIRVFDIRKRRMLYETPQYADEDDLNTRAPLFMSAPTSLLVTPDGSVAWITLRPDELGGGSDVFYAPRVGPFRLLDQGPDVVGDSLAINDRYVYWQRGGPKVAPR